MPKPFWDGASAGIFLTGTVTTLSHAKQPMDYVAAAMTGLLTLLIGGRYVSQTKKNLAQKPADVGPANTL